MVWMWPTEKIILVLSHLQFRVPVESALPARCQWVLPSSPPFFPPPPPLPSLIHNHAEEGSLTWMGSLTLNAFCFLWFGFAFHFKCHFSSSLWWLGFFLLVDLQCMTRFAINVNKRVLIAGESETDVSWAQFAVKASLVGAPALQPRRPFLHFLH